MKGLIGAAVVKSALHSSNIFVVFVFGILLGLVICWLLYVVLHKIFFWRVKRNKALQYFVIFIGSILWGWSMAIFIEDFSFEELLLSMLSVSFGVGLCLFIFAKFIYFIVVPLNIEEQLQTHSRVGIRFVKVFLIISLILICSVIGAPIGLILFVILWIASYIAFGNLNPFFAFKYKGVKISRKHKDEDIIDTEIVEFRNLESSKKSH